MARAPRARCRPSTWPPLGKAASYAIASDQLTITLSDEGTLVFR